MKIYLYELILKNKTGLWGKYFKLYEKREICQRNSKLMPHKNECVFSAETELDSSLLIFFFLIMSYVLRLLKGLRNLFYNGMCHRGQHVSVSLFTALLCTHFTVCYMGVCVYTSSSQCKH